MRTKYNTVQSVFDIAIHLIDAQHESTGSTKTSDTKEYELRTPSLVNSILDRVLPASDSYAVHMHMVYDAAQEYGETIRRPVVAKVTSLESKIQLDERLCTGVLPYGLAGLLLTEENPTLANFFWRTFLEQLEDAKRGMPAVIEDVENVYGGWGTTHGGIEHGEFSRW